MKFILLFFTGIFNKLIRNVYWLVNASRIQFGNKCKIEFPLIVEGKGTIVVKDHAFLGAGARLKCEQGGQIYLSERSVVGGNVEISVVSGNTFTLGRDSLIYENSICHVHSNWLIDFNVAIASNCQIFSREQGCHGSFQVGSNTRVGDFCIIDLSDNVEIGKDVAIGPRTTIYTHDHDYTQSDLVAPWKGAPVTKSVVIEDGCWIGSNVTILPGVSIGRNSIVATGAVVTKPVPADTLWAGVPARQIKKLDQPASNGT